MRVRDRRTSRNRSNGTVLMDFQALGRLGFDRNRIGHHSLFPWAVHPETLCKRIVIRTPPALATRRVGRREWSLLVRNGCEADRPSSIVSENGLESRIERLDLIAGLVTSLEIRPRRERPPSREGIPGMRGRTERAIEAVCSISSRAARRAAAAGGTRRGVRLGERGPLTISTVTPTAYCG